MDRPFSPSSLLERWRVAERRAFDLEDVVLQKNMLYVQGRGPAPTPRQIDVAHTARQEARELFAAAMQALGVPDPRE